MWPHKQGYDFIAVNFGGYILCKTLDEARTAAQKMIPDKGHVYTRGFFSERLGKMVGQNDWFPDDKTAF